MPQTLIRCSFAVTCAITEKQSPCENSILSKSKCEESNEKSPPTDDFTIVLAVPPPSPLRVAPGVDVPEHGAGKEGHVGEDKGKRALVTLCGVAAWKMNECD